MRGIESNAALARVGRERPAEEAEAEHREERSEPVPGRRHPGTSQEQKGGASGPLARAGPPRAVRPHQDPRFHPHEKGIPRVRPRLGVQGEAKDREARAQGTGIVSRGSSHQVEQGKQLIGK